MVVAMMSAFAVCASCTVAVLVIGQTFDPADNAGGSWKGTGPWLPATATHYDSWPRCCKESPNYDPNADTTECDVYSGCRWKGMFAGVSGQKSYQWVKDTNIVSFYEVGQTPESWERKWKGKRVELRNPSTGKTLSGTILDRCDDSDCKGCCTRNAKRNGGTLIDLEWHTAERFYAPGGVQDVAKIEWRQAK